MTSKAINQTPQKKIEKTANYSNYKTKVINISSSLNKGNHECDSVRYLILIRMVLIEKIYQTLKTMFDHFSKHLEVHQKYSAARRIFNSHPGVWKSAQTRTSTLYMSPQNFVTTLLLR